MRTREEILSFLDTIPLETITSINKEDKSYIFDTQIQAAKEVVSYLASNTLRTNHVILIAKMQSGKTGTCNAIANFVMNTPLKDEMHIDKVLYLTGMNDCGLANQTYDRVLEQVTGATCENTVDKLKSKLPSTIKPEYYILKNNTLRSFKYNIGGTLVFIDESHFGSKELNVLTSFMKEHGVDWKNKNSLIQNNVYIVSVSATPFDEIVSDTLDCKPMVELSTDENYIGVSEYFEKDLIFPATKNDLDTGDIAKYVEDAYNRMMNNGEKGVVIIRTRNFEYFHNHDFINKTFNIIDMDASGSKIEYDLLEDKVDELIKENDRINRIDLTRRNKNIPSFTKYKLPEKVVKPILVLIKGAFRAGITIKPKIKDLIYMVYDFSTDANATAQALLGRMCGYRNLEHSAFNSYLYVNEKFARMYAQWENNFSNKTLIPSSRTKWVWIDNDYNGSGTRIGTKPCGNFAVDLKPPEIIEIIRLSNNSSRVNRKATEKLIRDILSAHDQMVEYDYFFDTYLKGRNNYADSTQDLRFDNFSASSATMQFRPEKCKKFVRDTGRTSLQREDLGKRGISVVFDANVVMGEDKVLHITGNKRLLVYYFEIAQQKQMANHETLYCLHKDTSL